MAPGMAVLVSCGSFNPPTIMHLRLFELARDHLKRRGIEVLGGIISPTNDKYKKPSLVASVHRLEMVRLALIGYDFVKCSAWETAQQQWCRTRSVLEEYQKQMETLASSDSDPVVDLPHPYLPQRVVGQQDPVPRLLFLCGGDLLESFGVPGLWKSEDIEAIVKQFGLVIVSREGSQPSQYVDGHDILRLYKDNIHLVTESIPNDISSTRVRKAVANGDSVRFLVPDAVIDYIQANGLYK